MASCKKSSREQRDLRLKKILELGSEWFLPCERCSRLDRPCIRVDDSSKCRGCVKANNVPCVGMSNPSEKNWDRLLDAHEKIDKREDAVHEEIFRLQREVVRLKKQKKLLHRRARDFLKKDVKTVEELEELEEKERFEAERKRVEKERVDAQAADIARVADAQTAQFVAASDQPIFADLSFDFSVSQLQSLLGDTVSPLLERSQSAQ